MRKLFLHILLCCILPMTMLAKTEVEHSSGECFTVNRVWTRTDYWQTDANGNRQLVCTMGVGCNGKAFNTCDERVSGDGGGMMAEGPARPYYDAVHGDSLRAKFGDNENHLTELMNGGTEIRVMCDRLCLYKVFNLANGALVYEGAQPVPAGMGNVISTVEMASGPYMVIAYDPLSGVSVGYGTFMR